MKRRPSAAPSKALAKKPKIEDRPKHKLLTVPAPPITVLKDGVLVQNHAGGGGHALCEAESFAEGEFRYVYRGKYDKGERHGEECVRKEFKTGCVYEVGFFQKDIDTVRQAAKIIKGFNELGILNKPIYVNEPEVWVGDKGTPAEGQKMLVEPMIKGEYFKFNSNTGYAAPDSDTMQALSHYSYHHSKGECLLCDLQGGRYTNCYILTDPVILSKSKKFGPTDLGEKGINNFMAHHKCNRFCDPSWSLPAPTKLVPTFKAMSGTTFGAGVPLFSNKTIQDLQDKVRQCWEKEVVKGGDLVKGGA